VKSRKIEDAIGNVGKTGGISMTESRNVEANGERLRPVEIARGMSADGEVRSRDVECWKRKS
jgi:hypothetical protein